MRPLVRCGILLGAVLSFVAFMYCVLGSAANSLATARQRAHAAGCLRNLKQIAQAVGSYTARHRTLPPSLEQLTKGVPSVEFEGYCMHVEPELAVWDVGYVWNPSSGEICRDAEPHVITGAPVRYQVNFLAASGEVGSHVRHSFPPFLMSALILFLLVLGVSGLWLFRRIGPRHGKANAQRVGG